MGRVIVVGAGIAGLSAAIHASVAGHHVVILEKSSRIGGRGTSQNQDGFSLHFGPHLIDKSGPFFKLCRKLGRKKISISPLRTDKIEVIGEGFIRPIGNITRVIENRRAINDNLPNNKISNAVNLLSTWGGQSNPARKKSLLKNKLAVSNEGWIGLIGRLSAALDEIGVLIETNSEVAEITGNTVQLSDGRKVECDTIILASGLQSTKKLLEKVDEKLCQRQFGKATRITSSVIEAALESRPLNGKHCLIDTDKKMVALDYIAIQPKLGSTGSHISAIAIDGLSKEDRRYQNPEDRLMKLEQFLDSHLAGWRSHIIGDLRQKTITTHVMCPNVDFLSFSKYNIILAGDWLSSDYALSDRATASGQQAVAAIKKLTTQNNQ